MTPYSKLTDDSVHLADCVTYPSFRRVLDNRQKEPRFEHAQYCDCVHIPLPFHFTHRTIGIFDYGVVFAYGRYWIIQANTEFRRYRTQV